MEGRVVYLTEVPDEQARIPQMFEGVPDFNSVSDIARILGVCERTIRREIAAKRLRVAHVGRRVIVTKQALVEYVKDCEGCNE